MKQVIAAGALSKYSRCQFCGGLYTPPAIRRTPSETCDSCWLIIQAAIANKK